MGSLEIGHGDRKVIKVLKKYYEFIDVTKLIWELDATRDSTEAILVELQSEGKVEIKGDKVRLAYKEPKWLWWFEKELLYWVSIGFLIAALWVSNYSLFWMFVFVFGTLCLITDRIYRYIKSFFFPKESP